MMNYWVLISLRFFPPWCRSNAALRATRLGSGDVLALKKTKHCTSVRENTFCFWYILRWIARVLFLMASWTRTEFYVNQYTIFTTPRAEITATIKKKGYISLPRTYETVRSAGADKVSINEHILLWSVYEKRTWKQRINKVIYFESNTDPKNRRWNYVMIPWKYILFYVRRIRK